MIQRNDTTPAVVSSHRQVDLRGLCTGKMIAKCLRHSFGITRRARSVHDRCNLCFLVNRNRRRKKTFLQFAKRQELDSRQGKRSIGDYPLTGSIG